MTGSTLGALDAPTQPPSAWHRFLDSDFVYSFRRTPTAMGSAAVLLLFILVALFAPWIAPQNPFDPAALELMIAHTASLDRGRPVAFSARH